MAMTSVCVVEAKLGRIKGKWIHKWREQEDDSCNAFCHLKETEATGRREVKRVWFCFLFLKAGILQAVLY